MRDWQGIEIDVGDTIHYAVKHSCHVEINEAIVLETGIRPTRYGGPDFPFVTAE